MSDKKSKLDGTTKITVEFLKDYVASRGPSISGQKGDTRTFRATPELVKLADEEREGGAVLKIVKKSTAAQRAKATAGERETAK